MFLVILKLYLTIMNLNIFNSDKSYHQFVRMLYDESNGDIIYDPYHEPTIYNGLENIHF